MNHYSRYTLKFISGLLCIGLFASCQEKDKNRDVVDSELAPPEVIAVDAVWQEVESEDCRVKLSGPSDPVVSESSSTWDVGNVRINKFEFGLFENSYIFWCARVQAPSTIQTDEQRLLDLLAGWGLDNEMLSEVEYLGYTGFESLVDGPFDLAGDNVVRGFQMGNTFVILAAYEGAGESFMQEFFDSLALLDE